MADVNATVEDLEKAKVLDALYKNPKTSKKLLGLLKENDPSLRIPEIDAEVEVLGSLKPHLEEIGKTKAELQKELQDVRLERAVEKAKREHGLSDAEFTEVAKIAEEKKIGDFGAAKEFWQNAKQVGDSRSVPETTIHMPNYKGLHENPVQWARDEARKALREYEQANRRR